MKTLIFTLIVLVLALCLYFWPQEKPKIYTTYYDPNTQIRFVSPVRIDGGNTTVFYPDANKTEVDNWFDNNNTVRPKIYHQSR